jgi:hypothetical protein
LFGEAGDDSLEGGSGDDLLDGGDGRDTADYGAAFAGFTIDLVARSRATLLPRRTRCAR